MHRHPEEDEPSQCQFMRIGLETLSHSFFPAHNVSYHISLVQDPVGIRNKLTIAM
jgi:hypothetical protein